MVGMSHVGIALSEHNKNTVEFSKHYQKLHSKSINLKNFAGDVAHDLEVPLTKITFNLKLLEFNHDQTRVKEAKKLVIIVEQVLRERQ